MSTSCNPALEPEPAQAVRPFPYPELPAGTAPLVPALGTGGALNSGNSETAAAHEAALRELGRQEGEGRAAAAYEQRLKEIRESVRSALTDFSRERAAYYRQVESEVVQLALAIARKILRREAQIDPLLLAGMARVVLDKVESGTKVLVRVHPQQLSECRAYFAQHMEARDVPEVEEDPTLPIDHCVLETALGTTELGAEVQLKEIEQGLFDLLERRPPSGI